MILMKKAVLLSITISNCIHSGNEDKARQIVLDYEAELIKSKLYGYFLRNSATLFQGETANSYWEKSITAFQSASDKYGELTTVVNMSRVLIRSGNSCRGKVAHENVPTTAFYPMVLSNYTLPQIIWALYIFHVVTF